jgi:hypothetical protein
MRYKILNVVLEILDDCCIGVKLQCIWRKRAFAAGNVESRPAQENEFSAVVVVLIISALELFFKRNKLHT